MFLNKSGFAYSAYSYLKAKQQEYAITREQEFYKKLSVKSSPPHRLEERIAKVLAAKRNHRFNKQAAGLHFVYATSPSNWEPHNIPPGIRSLGNLTCYYYRERGFNDASSDWLEKRHRLDSDLVAFIEETHKRHPIDMFIGYMGGWQISPETIRSIGDMGIVTCGFNLDDKLSFRGKWAGGRWSGPAAVAAAYDLNLTNAPSSLVKYEAEGGAAIFWPEAADPHHFRPLNLPFEFDVSFVGACYGYRPILIKYLRKHGIKVEAFGPGWPNGLLTEAEMVNLYSRSRINLGFGGIGYSMKAQCLKGRDFEVPMCGALYLTSDNPELDLVYKVGEEVLAYRDERDCLSKINSLLADRERCADIRSSARARCLRDHTWEARFRQLVNLVSPVIAESGGSDEFIER